MAFPSDPASPLIPAARAILGAMDRQALGAALAESLSRLDIDEYALFMRREADRSTLGLVNAWDREGRQLPAARPWAKADLAGLERLDPGGAHVVHDDCESSPGLDEPVRRMLAEAGVRAAATFPLLDQGTILGVFCAIRHKPHVHTTEELQLLELVAQMTALVLVNIERRERLAAQVNLARALYKAANDQLRQVSGAEEMLKATVRMLIDQLGFSAGWIGTVDAERQLLVSRATADRTNVENPLIEYDLNDRSVGSVQAFHEGQPLVLTNLLARARAEGWGDVAAAAQMHSATYVPLKVGEEIFGVLGVASSQESMSDDEVALVVSFGNQVAGAITRERLDRERAEQVENLQRAYETQTRLLEMVRELSTPVIPIHQGILALPLVGTIDSIRSAQILEVLLDAIVRAQASVVIVDVTGVPLVDSGVADHLLKAIRAASLLGARCVLSGISPVVAQTVVQLGVDLSAVVTCRNLQAGIAYALRLGGLEVGPVRAR